MTKTWNPEIRARRIPGPSVRTVSVIGLFSALVLLISVVIFFIAAATTAAAATPVVLKTFAALIGATVLVASTCDLWVHYGLQAAELRAGYTTAYRTPDRVPYVDPRSNRVIRLAGEPELDRDEHRRRLALAREAARRDKELRRLRGATPEPEPSDWAAVIRDADGTPLADGDTVIVLKKLTGKGPSAVVPAGTRLRNIRLRHEADDDRLVGAVARGVGPVRLRPTAVRKS